MRPGYLPSLSPHNQARDRVRRLVRQTSRAAYHDARDRMTGRKADVLRWLAAHWNAHHNWPTSAELAQANPDRRPADLALVLYVRRGLSDLLRVGLVETHGDRMCAVAHRVCLVWRVVSR
jgi:hypothetical protein